MTHSTETLNLINERLQLTLRLADELRVDAKDGWYEVFQDKRKEKLKLADMLEQIAKCEDLEMVDCRYCEECRKAVHERAYIGSVGACLQCFEEMRRRA